MDNQYFSKEGLEKLKQELQHRMEVLRPEIAQRIKEAKEQGDLSENAEFDAAKEAQSMNEGRIEDIRKIIENAVVVTDGAKSGGVVGVGSNIEAESSGKKHHFVIVGVSESNPAEGFISNESPIGKALLGHKKGDVVEVRTPRGVMEYKIVSIK
ncbi:MAG TPA: transcription elongation factor GreA [Candidatus Paceibacterota bacterium]|nr:transcription elongation factor GreA [Candidatus Paceibacterota bacterium]